MVQEQINHRLDAILVTQIDLLLLQSKIVLTNQREYYMTVLVHEDSDW